MSPRQNSAIEDLLADPLIQSVMRADRVEPKELRTLLRGVANRLAPARAASGPAYPRPPLPRLAPLSAPGRISAGECGAAMCC